MSDQKKCECGHMKSWHRRKKDDTRCQKHECGCLGFVEKPIKEIDWEP